MTIRIDSTENRCVTTSTIGYMCLALTLWMVSMSMAGWFSQIYAHGADMLTPMAVILALMGILAHLRARSLDAIVFFGGALLFWTAHAAAGASGEPASYAGWYWAVWTVFFGYLWLGSFHASLPRQLFLLGMTLLLLTAALNMWTGLRILQVISGYIGLITALLAALISASGIIIFGKEQHSPNDEHRAGKEQHSPNDAHHAPGEGQPHAA